MYDAGSIESKYNTYYMVSMHMTCKIVCQQCELEQRVEQCVSAYERAKQHEAKHTDHWVSVHDPRKG
jgi:hypothetical protein